MLNRYFYETEQYKEALRFMKTTFDILGKTHHLLYANAITLCGLIDLDILVDWEGGPQPHCRNPHPGITH
jgi:hypothetical protein